MSYSMGSSTGVLTLIGYLVFLAGLGVAMAATYLAMTPG